ncbi:PhoPQ-activated pathogenicity-related family protein [Halomonas heilongjiangensis]|nr:PhoPQ-activated protein PqaA family protein [Halomonas heilongjiangensis]
MRTPRRLWLAALCCSALMTAGNAGAESATPPPDSPLAAYVATPDDSFAWRVERQAKLLGTDTTLIRLVSQRWRDTEWRHQLWLIDPTGGRGASQALLFIGSGTWPREGEPSHDPPREAPLFVALARALDTPVAVLRQVPFQPLFDGLSEDALIALSFSRFLEDPDDSDWPLLLPMVNSAVRAMDALQSLSHGWEQPIEAFTVTGASKRGWTTWLTAAVDARVTALAPMVFDILDMEPQLDHQRAVWGELSPQLADYTERGLDRQLASAAGRRLQALVDPYHYRDALTQPKLLVLATNDAYWPVDALNLYWTALPEPRYVLYLPNQGHRARDVGRLVPTLSALHRHAAQGRPLPDLQWDYHHEGDDVTLRVTASPAPAQARAWVARAPERDFREARWEPRPMQPDGDAFTITLPRPNEGYAALFGELEFAQDEGGPMTLSTTVQVVAGEGEPPP